MNDGASEGRIAFEVDGSTLTVRDVIEGVEMRFRVDREPDLSPALPAIFPLPVDRAGKDDRLLDPGLVEFPLQALGVDGLGPHRSAGARVEAGVNVDRPEAVFQLQHGLQCDGKPYRTIGQSPIPAR